MSPRLMARLALTCLVSCLLAGCDDAASTPSDTGPDISSDAGRDGAWSEGPLDLAADRFVPFDFSLTVNDLPAAMNGSEPFTNKAGQSESFRLALPPSGFCIDVRLAGSEAKVETLSVRADVALGALPAGGELASRFTLDQGSARYCPAPADALPLGPVTFTASVDEGTKTHTRTLTVDIAARDQREPFALEDTWLLIFSQDLYTIRTRTDAAGNWLVESVPGTNGIPDFVEDLRIVGFGTPSMHPAAAKAQRDGQTGTNAILLHWLKRLILEGTRRAYLLDADGRRGPESPRLRIVAEGDPGAPDASTWQLQELQGGETSRRFSMIAIGGGDPSRRLLGLSQTVDLRNRRNEANVGPTYGVFPTTALATAATTMAQDSNVKQLLTFLLGEFVPELGVGGRRVGEDPHDGLILGAGYDPTTAPVAARARHDRLTFLAKLLGRLLGALTAHEMGHSLGLVASGPPPHGLFGGEAAASFTGAARTTSGHIDTPGFNIMEAGPGSAPGATINFSQYFGMPSFNALNRAYLQGRLLLLERP